MSVSRPPNDFQHIDAPLILEDQVDDHAGVSEWKNPDVALGIVGGAAVAVGLFRGLIGSPFHGTSSSTASACA
ncbi:MAG: hypothetical protein QOG76_5728 [Pseudonocardiales bacterium]|nr:hypothetical protein [Pseudonocardiales bacterium]